MMTCETEMEIITRVNKGSGGNFASVQSRNVSHRPSDDSIQITVEANGESTYGSHRGRGGW